MSRFVRCFLGLATAATVTAAAVDDGFVLQMLTDSNAKCLDGSQGGFYYRPGSASTFGDEFGVNTWIIELEGGGWCSSLSDCAGRSKSAIGSSKSWPKTGIPGMDGGANGMLSSDCSINRFCNASKVHYNYCDGASFASSAIAPSIAPDNTTLWFRGAAIFDASVDATLSLGMSGAKKIILKGCSAGGLATILHADYFFNRIATEVPLARTVSMPDAGFFRDHLTFSGQQSWSPLYKWVYAAQNVTQVNSDCLANYAVSEQWHCFFAEYTLPFITSPLFMTQDLDDSWQMSNIYDIPCKPYINCNATEMQGLQDYRTEMLASLTALTSSPTNGAYLSACYQHCHQNVNSWDKELINNVTVAEAFESWWSRSGTVPRMTIDGLFNNTQHTCQDSPYDCTRK